MNPVNLYQVRDGKPQWSSFMPEWAVKEENYEITNDFDSHEIKTKTAYLVSSCYVTVQGQMRTETVSWPDNKEFRFFCMVDGIKTKIQLKLLNEPLLIIKKGAQEWEAYDRSNQFVNKMNRKATTEERNGFHYTVRQEFDLWAEKTH